MLGDFRLQLPGALRADAGFGSLYRPRDLPGFAPRRARIHRAGPSVRSSSTRSAPAGSGASRSPASGGSHGYVFLEPNECDRQSEGDERDRDPRAAPRSTDTPRTGGDGGGASGARQRRVPVDWRLSWTSLRVLERRACATACARRCTRRSRSRSGFGLRLSLRVGGRADLDGRRRAYRASPIPIAFSSWRGQAAYEDPDGANFAGPARFAETAARIRRRSPRTRRSGRHGASRRSSRRVRRRSSRAASGPGPGPSPRARRGVAS